MKLDRFLEIASEIQKPKEEIREVLRQKFGTYNPDKADAYMAYLRIYYNLVETEPKANICPICGSETIPDVKLNSRRRKIPGWICKAGGVSHYYEWRTNIVLSERRKQKEAFYGDGHGGTDGNCSEIERYYWYVIYEYHPEKLDRLNLK